MEEDKTGGMSTTVKTITLLLLVVECLAVGRRAGALTGSVSGFSISAGGNTAGNDEALSLGEAYEEDTAPLVDGLVADLGEDVTAAPTAAGSAAKPPAAAKPKPKKPKAKAAAKPTTAKPKPAAKAKDEATKEKSFKKDLQKAAPTKQKAPKTILSKAVPNQVVSNQVSKTMDKFMTWQLLPRMQAFQANATEANCHAIGRMSAKALPADFVDKNKPNEKGKNAGELWCKGKGFVKVLLRSNIRVVHPLLGFMNHRATCKLLDPKFVEAWSKCKDQDACKAALESYATTTGKTRKQWKGQSLRRKATTWVYLYTMAQKTRAVKKLGKGTTVFSILAKQLLSSLKLWKPPCTLPGKQPCADSTSVFVGYKAMCCTATSCVTTKMCTDANSDLCIGM